MQGYAMVEVRRLERVFQAATEALNKLQSMHMVWRRDHRSTNDDYEQLERQLGVVISAMISDEPLDDISRLPPPPTSMRP